MDTRERAEKAVEYKKTMNCAQAVLMAYEAERRICHIFHRCEHHRALAKIYVSYLHNPIVLIL